MSFGTVDHGIKETHVAEDLNTGSLPREIQICHHVDPLYLAAPNRMSINTLTSLLGPNKTPIFCDDSTPGTLFASLSKAPFTESRLSTQTSFLGSSARFSSTCIASSEGSAIGPFPLCANSVMARFDGSRTQRQPSKSMKMRRGAK